MATSSSSIHGRSQWFVYIVPPSVLCVLCVESARIVAVVRTVTPKDVVSALRAAVIVHARPCKLFCTNNVLFRARELARWAEVYGIEIVHTHHARSEPTLLNGKQFA